MNEMNEYIIGNVRTNSFPLRGRILENRVHQYLVNFEPEVTTNNSELRHKILFGANRVQRQNNYKTLFDYFGKFEFDNHCLYCMGRPKRDSSDNRHLRLSEGYTVFFQWQDSYMLADPVLPLSQQECMLNIFNRKKMKDADYTKVGRGWFYKRPNPPHPNMRPIDIGMSDFQPAQCRVIMYDYMFLYL